MAPAPAECPHNPASLCRVPACLPCEALRPCSPQSSDRTPRPHRGALGVGCAWAGLRLCAVLLTVLVCAWSAPRALAQGAQPLSGQGVDPVTAGLVNESVPVYVSVSLEKLETIDEIGYTFGAVFTIVMTWRNDPRINDTVNLINFVGKDSQAVQAQQLKNCTKWATITGASSNPDCVAALSKFGGNCERVCFMGSGWACCDNLWLPGIYIANLLYMSQDRIESDQVWLYGATIGGLNKDWGSVFRVVRVHGIFSNTFNFRKFPFDSQILKFQMSPIPPANFHIVPSIVGKSVLGLYGFVFQYDGRAFSGNQASTQSGQSKFSASEVTGWQFIGDDNQTMGFCCDDRCANLGAPPAPNTTELPNGLNPSDPQFYAYQNLQRRVGTPVQGLTCALCIYVERLANYYVANDIIPVVVNSLLSFTVVFARPIDLDIRLSTLVTLSLALVAVQFVIADQLPRTEYVTAFSALVLTSYVLIVVLILESLLVFYVSVLDENYRRKKAALDKIDQTPNTGAWNSTLSRMWTVGTNPAQSRDAYAPEDPEAESAQPSSALVTERPTDPAQVQVMDASSDEAFEDGRPPPSPEANTQPPQESGVRCSRPTRFMYRPFMYTEEKLLAMFQGEETAFRFATIIDNISLGLLGLGYIIAVVLVFVLAPTQPNVCTLA